MLAIPLTIFNLYAAPLGAVLYPLAMIFSQSQKGISILGLFGILSLFLTASTRLSVFPITGPSPAEPLTMKQAANNRTIMNGAATGYDMVCLFPTTRKQLFMSFFKWWVPVMLISAAEIAAAVWVNFTDSSRACISAYSVGFALIVTAIPNVGYYKPKNQFFATVLIIAGYVLTMIFMMISLITEISISIYLPAPAAVIIPIAAIIYNIIFFAKTAILGDFARNGEKIN